MRTHTDRKTTGRTKKQVTARLKGNVFVSWAGIVVILTRLPCALFPRLHGSVHTHALLTHLCASVREHVLSKRVGSHQMRCFTCTRSQFTYSHTARGRQWHCHFFHSIDQRCVHVCALYRTGDVSHLSNNSYHGNNKNFGLYILIYLSQPRQRDWL